jgi:uncharacterized heparinase superfamily protein
LSFEMSSGTELVFVNGGAPGASDTRWRTTARATASHNALVLAESSSSKLIRHAALAGFIGAPPIRGPAHVKATLEEHGGNVELSAEHDGYADRFGLVHKRALALSANGTRLLGVDRLVAPKLSRKPKDPLPFALHFHLHPDAACRLGDEKGVALITLHSGKVWHFNVEGASLSIEDSTFFVDSAGPRAALQLVVRGTATGDAEVRWVVEARGH